MSDDLKYTIIDGIKCFHPNIAESFSGYPSSGFDATDDVNLDSFWVVSRTRLLRREIIKAVGGVPNSKFLEIGCGIGTFLQSLSSEPGIQLLGSEISLRGLRSAKAQCPAVEFIQMDAALIPFVSEFDVIGAFDVIEHIEDDMAVLRGIHKALKPEGRLVLTVPQYEFMWGSIDEFVHHQRRYNRKNLLSKMESAGFQVDYVTSFVFMLFPLMLVSRLFDRKRKLKPTAADFNKQVRFNPFVNRLFGWFMRIDEFMIACRYSLPWGGTLLVVAKKGA